MYEILTRLKTQPHLYTRIDISYSPSRPLFAPLIVNLPANGLRLRFDGPDQKLRLIEIIDFSKTQLTYDGKDIVKVSEGRATGNLGSPTSGPSFRYVYDKLLGPAFPGEYVRPESGSNDALGHYILSYPGIAFSFPVPLSAWLSEENFVTVLSSPAAELASSMAIFTGTSWQEACQDLYSRPYLNPRPLVAAGRLKEQQVDEIELIRVTCDGKVRLLRRSASPFEVSLGETSPQDLVAELGPPDAIYTKSDRRLSIHRVLKEDPDRGYAQRDGQLTKYDDASETDQSSSTATTDDSEDGSPSTIGDAVDPSSSNEYFFNYFQHGLDVFISDVSMASPDRHGLNVDASDKAKSGSNRLVATKLILHGNVPGSYPFNRYRRSRWVIDPRIAGFDGLQLDSETPFAEIANTLQLVLQDSARQHADPTVYQRGMPINRDWDSPGSSCELLGGWEEQGSDQKNKSSDANAPAYGNTELFGYPGLIFEVLPNDIVSCLTVY